MDRRRQLWFNRRRAAGITAGGAHAQTRVFDILGQATAGVRLFGIRVAAFATGNRSCGARRDALQAFHAADPVHEKETRTRSSSCGRSCPPRAWAAIGPGPGTVAGQRRSKRSRFITLVHAATKSRTNFSCASSPA